jgi:ubiquitin-like protein ATG12
MEESKNSDKIIVHLKPVANAPILKKNKFKVSAGESFAMIMTFVAGQIKAKDGIFLYCNSAFSPSPDSVIGDLFLCFKVGNELIVNYAITEAWG